ncbi:uncharacterized protein SPSK_05560 [Sporothrix schenckii 1099-18]|uniref:Uncharacterized protein n=2 Tax=Sporothrix schenckii TaxID=29908 RepID=U7Q2N3_SPOS1|nr:uncharacterized protein SPSK_05560 [Sporothrix schenckii 1099-18]ERT02123.1 hypothetical protein HMPREF1624_00420 [Sporothrix schenckii ATCC 58251]KJR80663.1 hypothetical protein SPSK_05560 [Sporothrix schenckii 1099-18]
MGKEPSFDVVLDDQLDYTYVPQVTAATRAAAAEERATRRFLERWTERGGISRDGADDEDEDDDIGDRFRDDGRYLANENRDITRLLDNVRRIHANDPNAPDLPTGHKMVLLDRARRVKFGYVKPPPQTLVGGLDGGVNTCVYQRRRVRPGEDDALSLHRAPAARTSIAPRHRADTGTACIGVLPDTISTARVPRPVTSRRSGVATRRSTTQTNKRNARLQRKLAEYLLRQPAESIARGK